MLLEVFTAAPTSVVPILKDVRLFANAYNFILNLHACGTEQLWPEAWAGFEAPVEEGGPKWPSSGRMCEQVHSVRQTPAQIPNIGKVPKIAATCLAMALLIIKQTQLAQCSSWQKCLCLGRDSLNMIYAGVLGPCRICSWRSEDHAGHSTCNVIWAEAPYIV